MSKSNKTTSKLTAALESCLTLAESVKASKSLDTTAVRDANTALSAVKDVDKEMEAVIKSVSSLDDPSKIPNTLREAARDSLIAELLKSNKLILGKGGK